MNELAKIFIGSAAIATVATGGTVYGIDRYREHLIASNPPPETIEVVDQRATKLEVTLPDGRKHVADVPNTDAGMHETNLLSMDYFGKRVFFTLSDKSGDTVARGSVVTKSFLPYAAAGRIPNYYELDTVSQPNPAYEQWAQKYSPAPGPG